MDENNNRISPTSVIEMTVPRRFLFHPHDFGVIWDLTETKNRILWLYQNFRISQTTYERIAASLEAITYEEHVNWNLLIENTNGNGVKALLFWMQDHGIRFDMDPIDLLISAGELDENF
jgi:hypothetical protein